MRGILNPLEIRQFWYFGLLFGIIIPFVRYRVKKQFSDFWREPGENWRERINYNQPISLSLTNIFKGMSAVNDKQYYEKLFKDYPDVVDLITFRKMLGGISDSAARRLVKKNRVKHFCVSNAYLIPKIWAIQYLISKKYDEDKIRYSVQI